MTAEELMDLGLEESGFQLYGSQRNIFKNKIIQFAQFHVQLALLRATEYAEIETGKNGDFIDRNSILNAYPLDNIK